MSETAAVPDGRTTSCRGVLVVEDDEDIRETIMSVLEDEGYAVHGATNGQEGLEVLSRNGRPCLILLDLMMPVMSGRELLAHLRSHDLLAPIPVVIVSAWPKEAENIPGVQGFVKKPVDLGALLELVERYCGAERRDAP